MGSISLLPGGGRSLGFPCGNLGGCSPLGLELTRWGICPTLSEHAMEKHPLPASLSLPLLHMGTCPVKVILMCALFSTCFQVLGNSETKWGGLNSKTSKKEFIFCSFQEHLYISQTRAAFIPWATVGGTRGPRPPGVDNYKRRSPS